MGKHECPSLTPLPQEKLGSELGGTKVLGAPHRPLHRPGTLVLLTFPGPIPTDQTPSQDPCSQQRSEQPAPAPDLKGHGGCYFRQLSPSSAFTHLLTKRNEATRMPLPQKALGPKGRATAHQKRPAAEKLKAPLPAPVSPKWVPL